MDGIFTVALTTLAINLAAPLPRLGIQMSNMYIVAFVTLSINGRPITSSSSLLPLLWTLPSHGLRLCLGITAYITYTSSGFRCSIIAHRRLRGHHISAHPSHFTEAKGFPVTTVVPERKALFNGQIKHKSALFPSDRKGRIMRIMRPLKRAGQAF